MAACVLSAWTTGTFNDKCGQHVDNELISDVNTFARSLFVLRESFCSLSPPGDEYGSETKAGSLVRTRCFKGSNHALHFIAMLGCSDNNAIVKH